MITSNGNFAERMSGRVVGCVASVPANTVTNDDLIEYEAAAEAAKLTGVEQRRHAVSGQTTESLCIAAAHVLLMRLKWRPEDVDGLVYVTQTPGAPVPAAAYGIHSALGLQAHCPALEVNWSCAGYVYGLWLAHRLAQPVTHAERRRILLLVGDTTSRIIDPIDRATGPLFGDAGSATAILGGFVSESTGFVLGTDGQNGQRLSQMPGGMLQMDGAAVFNFTLRTVPKLVEDLMMYGAPNLFLFHQANKFMLDHLAKKMKLAEQFGADSIPSNVSAFGNCSSASVPLLLCDRHALPMDRAKSKFVAMLGYGAGWSWGGAMVDLRRLECAELVEV